MAKVYTLFCNGKPIGIFRDEERAKALRDALIEDPVAFLTIDEWEPGELYPYVKFEEEKE